MSKGSPICRSVQIDLPAHRRFVATILKRLNQLTPFKTPMGA